MVTIGRGPQEPARGVPTVLQETQAGGFTDPTAFGKQGSPTSDAGPRPAPTPLLTLPLPPGTLSPHLAKIYAPVVYQALGKQGQAKAERAPAFPEPWNA